MANRVQPDEVRIIMRDVTATAYPDDTVNAYITTANATINEYLVSQGLSNAILKEIERWLSAHLMAISKVRTTKKEEAGTAKLEYIDTYGTGLDASDYGPTVKALDSTGILASLGGKAASIYAIPEFD